MQQNMTNESWVKIQSVEEQIKVKLYFRNGATNEKIYFEGAIDQGKVVLLDLHFLLDCHMLINVCKHHCHIVCKTVC